MLSACNSETVRDRGLVMMINQDLTVVLLRLHC